MDASIPDLGSRDPYSASRPASNASNGVKPGQTGRILRASSSVGGGQGLSTPPASPPSR